MDKIAQDETSHTAAPEGRIQGVRKLTFSFPIEQGAHWNKARPEFSQIVNAASLAMPYLETYLIRTMAKARPLVDDPALVKELNSYVAQETTHYRQHKMFNDTVAACGYASVAPFEEVLKRDYESFGQKRSLKFNMAYAEGFESMALAIGHMLVEDREHLFGGADPAVSSLVLWHFVEEIEHKEATFDVFHAIGGGYFWRIFGLLFATTHIMFRIGQGYRALLKEDGLWRNRRSRWRLAKDLGRIFRILTPKMLRILKPGYHPGKVADPDWVKKWWALYGTHPVSMGEQLGRLDTTRLEESAPALVTA